LGAAGASLALIVAAPFAGVEKAPKTVEAPKAAKPAITKTVKAPERKVPVAAAPVKKVTVPSKKIAAPKGYNFDVEVAPIRAAADAATKERAAEAAEAKVRYIENMA